MKTLLFLFLLCPLWLFSQHTIKDPDSGVTSKYAYDGQILERYKLDNDGYRHGKYEKWYSTGERRFIENWKHGRPYGKQEYWFKNGQLDMRVYKDDDAGWSKRYGEFIRYYENGNKRFHTIRDRKGNIQGTDTEWSEYGQLIKDHNYKDDRKHGVQKNWTDHYMSVLENYSEGNKDGVFEKWTDYAEEMYEGDFLYSIENWKDDKKHGRFLYYDTLSQNLIYENNYKYGLYDGVQKNYYEGGHTYEILEDDTLVYEDYIYRYLQLKSEENYTNGEKDGVQKNYYQIGNSGEYLKSDGTSFDDYSNIIDKRQLKSEENYTNGEKDGWCKYYNDQNGFLIEEGGYTTGKKNGTWKLYNSEELIKEEEYINGEIVRTRDWKNNQLTKESVKNQNNNGLSIIFAKDDKGFVRINYNGKYLDYLKFQNAEYISAIETSVNTGEDIIMEYNKNVIYYTDEIDRNERNKIIYIYKTDSLNLVLSQHIQKKGEKKIAKIFAKQANQEKIKKGSLSIIQRINFLENMIDSLSILLEDCNQDISRHNILLSHYSMNILPIEEYVENKSLKLDNEKSKDIYDLEYDYPEEFYVSEYTNRPCRGPGGCDLSSVPVSFLINDGAVGPFRLGMTDAELLEIFNSDPFFYNLYERLKQSRNYDEDCFVPCDIRIDTIYDYKYYYEECRKEFYSDPDNRDENPDEACGRSDYKSDFWNRLGVRQDGKAYRFKYEFIKQNNEWIRGYFIFCSNNDTIHTILFDTGQINEENETSDFFISKNGIHNYMSFEDLIELNEEYNKVDIFKVDSSSHYYSFYDNISLSYMYLSPKYFTNKEPEVCRLFINGFKITNREDLQLNPSALIKGSSIIELQESLMMRQKIE